MIIKAICKYTGGAIGTGVGTLFGNPVLGLEAGKMMGEIVGRLADNGAPEAFWAESFSDQISQSASDIMEVGYDVLDIF